MSLYTEREPAQRRPPITASAYFDQQSRKPPPPPPEPEPSHDQRDDDDSRLSERDRVRRAMQFRQMRELAWLRGVTFADLGVKLDSLPRDGLELGRELRLTVVEYVQLKDRLDRFPAFLPAGHTRESAKAIRDDFNRPARTAARARERAAKAARMSTVADLGCRASATYTVLDDRWKTALQVSKLLLKHHSRAFQPLIKRSLKMAVQRALGKLVTTGRAEVKRERSKNGLPVDLFRRR